LNVVVRVTPVVFTTGLVLIVNEAVVAPERTTVVAGTAAAAGLLEERWMVVSLRAGALRVTVPVAALPPVTDAGDALAARTDAVAMVSTPRPSYR